MAFYFEIGINTMFKVVCVVLPIVFVVGCSDEQNKVEDHLWKEQTELIDKARDVEGMLNDAALQQQREIEQQTR